MDQTVEKDEYPNRFFVHPDDGLAIIPNNASKNVIGNLLRSCGFRDVAEAEIHAHMQDLPHNVAPMSPNVPRLRRSGTTRTESG